MTCTYKDIKNGTSVLNFEFVADTQRILDTAEAAAQYFWLHGYGRQPTDKERITWDDISNAERLAILDAYVKQVLIDASKTYYVNQAVETARSAAVSDDKFIPYIKEG